MKAREYWQKRFEEIEKSSNQIGLDTYSQIEPAFLQAQRNVQKEIDSWYARFAANNKVTIQDARRMLSRKELDELKWDVDEFIKYGKENALDKQWMKELENASAKFHISKLEALKLRTQQAMEVAFGNELDAVDEMARKILTEDYYKSIFEIQKGFNIGFDVGQIDERKLNLLVNKPWATDGKNFSSRIWERKRQMVSELQQELTRTLIQGKSPDEAIKHMEKFVQGKVKNARNAAGRLVMTEQAYFHSVSQKEAFNDLDVEEFEIVATLDSHTSEICQEMDGKHFPMDEYSPGVTAPPFHVYCRSVTCPYFNDEWSIGERAARGEDGKTYYVPSDMNYQQWKASLVDGDTSGLQETVKEHTEAYNDVMKAINANNVDFNKVQPLSEQLTSEQIIERLAGGDKTNGSCSSLAFSYIGNKNGLNVLDFRGGDSQYVFSCNSTIQKILELDGVKGSITKVKKEISGTMEIIKGLEYNKEYYLAAGKHAAIIRNTEMGAEYLELQSAVANGWTSFENNRYGSMYNTLYKRFGCRKTVDKMKVGDTTMIFEKKVMLADVDSFKDNEEFAEILGYINTATDKQKKGVTGGVK